MSNIKLLSPILRTHVPEIRQKVTFSKILPELDFLSDTERRAIIEAENEDNGLDTLIRIICRSEDTLNYFTKFVRVLNRFNDSSDIAAKIIAEARNVHPTIDEDILFPPALTKSQNRSNETVGVKSSPHTSSSGTSTEARNGTSQRQKILQTVQREQTRTSNTPPDSTRIQVHGGWELDSLPNEVFCLFANELNEENKWERFGNKMKLKRREIRLFEQSNNPAKKLLDHIGHMTINEVFSCLHSADMSDIQTRLQIEILDNNQGTKLRSMENEHHSKLAEELNKEENWIKLANKMRLKRKDVKRLEKEGNPAKTLLDEHHHLTTEELADLLERAGLSNIIGDQHVSTQLALTRTPTNPEYQTSANQTNSSRNNLNELVVRVEVPLPQVNIEESLTENTDVEETSGENCHETEVKDTEHGGIAFMEDVRVQNADNREIQGYGLQCTSGGFSPVNNENEATYLACPEENNSIDKTPEQAHLALRKDADAQGDVFRDIKNSLPDIAS